MRNKFYLTNTQTAINLAKAFVGESQARNRYLFYSDIAKKEGFNTLERIFLETADNERGHAEMFFEYLAEGLGKVKLTPQVSVPVSKEDTSSNLLSAALGEREEWSQLYPEFGKVAEQEGFYKIAESFHQIASIEKRHDLRFTYLLQRFNDSMLFSLPNEATWKCINCGLHIVSKTAPDICPACHHVKTYFMTIFDELYPY